MGEIKGISLVEDTPSVSFPILIIFLMVEDTWAN